MTNPNNAVGTNGAYGGRTSVNAFNDVAAAYTRGIMSGWACAPDTGMAVSLGGDGNTRDVAIAEDNAGNKTTINNISGSPITVTLSAAPGSNSRIDAIVAYVDNPPQGNNTTSDNPTACGLIAVAGTPSASPSIPTDGAIRTAITADGASGTTAYYVVLATITVTTGTTDITSDDITAGPSALISINQIADSSITSGKINFNTYGAFSRYINGSQSYTAWAGDVAQFNSKDFDDIGCSYSSSTYKVTISQPGIWLFITTINTPIGNGTYGTAAIRNSDTTIASNRTISAGGLASSICVSLITKVNAGDTIDVFVAGSENQTNSTRAAQNFSGVCIFPNL